MSQRKRATGFALMDTAFAADAKFLRLSRIAKDPLHFAAATGVFWLVLAEARRARSRVVNWEDYSEYADQVKLLQDARLLVADGFEQETFDRWAPAYRSPWDVRRGTQDDEELRSSTDTSALLSSTQVISDPVTENGASARANGDDPSIDAYEFAVRILGYAPNSEDFSKEITDLELRFGVEATVQAEQDVARSALSDGRRLKPFDLIKEARTLLLTGKHREDRELTAAEQSQVAERRRQRDAALLADVQAQTDDAFRLCKCGQRKGSGAHGSNRDHDFEEAA